MTTEITSEILSKSGLMVLSQMRPRCEMPSAIFATELFASPMDLKSVLSSRAGEWEYLTDESRIKIALADGVLAGAALREFVARIVDRATSAADIRNLPEVCAVIDAIRMNNVTESVRDNAAKAVSKIPSDPVFNSGRIAMRCAMWACAVFCRYTTETLKKYNPIEQAVNEARCVSGTERETKAQIADLLEIIEAK